MEQFFQQPLLVLCSLRSESIENIRDQDILLWTTEGQIGHVPCIPDIPTVRQRLVILIHIGRPNNSVSLSALLLVPTELIPKTPRNIGLQQLREVLGLRFTIPEDSYYQQTRLLVEIFSLYLRRT